MKYEIGPIIQEDKNPQKIRRALARGCGGVVVDDPLPAAVAAETQSLLVTRNLVVQRLEDLPLAIMADQDVPGYHRWSALEPCLTETQRWLTDQFQWAVAGRLCRAPENVQGKVNLLRLWINNYQRLPWHIDLDNEEIYPDLHIHLAGAGMKVARPCKPLKMLFSDSKISPHLELPGLSLRSIPYKNAEHILRKALCQDMKERGVKMLELQPGQILIFNEKCLHESAGRNKPRLRAGIF